MASWYIPHIVLSCVLSVLTLLSFLHYHYSRKKKRKREAVLLRQDNSVRLVQRSHLSATQFPRDDVICIFKGEDVDDVIRECNAIENEEDEQNKRTRRKAKDRWIVLKTIQLLGFFSRRNKDDTKVTHIKVATVGGSRERSFFQSSRNKVRPMTSVSRATVAGAGEIVTLHRDASGEEIITVPSA